MLLDAHSYPYSGYLCLRMVILLCNSNYTPSSLARVIHVPEQSDCCVTVFLLQPLTGHRCRFCMELDQLRKNNEAHEVTGNFTGVVKIRILMCLSLTIQSILAY